MHKRRSHDLRLYGIDVPGLHSEPLALPEHSRAIGWTVATRSDYEASKRQIEKAVRVID